MGAGKEQQKIVPLVECFIRRNDEVLVFHRSPSRKHFPDWIAGVAGKIEFGERVDEACLREIREETGLEIENLRLRAIVSEILPKVELLIFIFVAEYKSGDIKESAEGKPLWIKIDELKMLKLAPYLKVVLPQILAKDYEGVTFYKFIIDAHNDIISYSSSRQ